MQDEIKAIQASQHRTEVVLTRMESDVKHHITRTEINERRVEKLEYIFIGLGTTGIFGAIITALVKLF